MNYTITRLEEASDNTFVRIDCDKPVYVERFIKKDKNIKDEVEDMVAELEIKYDAYVAPETPVAKEVEERQTVKESLRANKISEKKAARLAEKEKEVVKEEGLEEELTVK